MLGAMLLMVSLSDMVLKEQSARADWYVDGSGKVNVRKCEQFLAKTEQQFDLVVPRFKYIRVKGRERLFTNMVELTGSFGPGTIIGLTVFSVNGCSKHEIVHLVTAQLADKDRVVTEGVAVMLGGLGGGNPSMFDRYTARQTARDRRVRYGQFIRVFHTGGGAKTPADVFWYYLADSWVRELVSHHGGMPALVRFFQEQKNGLTASQAFVAVYGDTREATFDRWLYGKRGFDPSRK